MAKPTPTNLQKLKGQKEAYGGVLLQTRVGRSRARPVSARHSMHLVLRSSLAQQDWSLRRSKNQRKIAEILHKFCSKFRVQVLSMANVGNHLHLHIQMSTGREFKPFIRAVTAAMAMAITGASRWAPLNGILRQRASRLPHVRNILDARAV